MTVELKPLRRGDIRRCVEIEKILFPGDSPWARYRPACSLRRADSGSLGA